ncbi:N-acetylmuramic acid 6-phosphate etherase [Enterococcus sp. AZ196]|uniref:N-acetylmuramic acid 6-phosphate etherase n=1 Tax=Enterococcus sp. AZ196 TaxID=2774659 RepID=UPI003D271F22
MKISHLATERRNENSMNIDRMATIDLVQTINNEDKMVADAVEKVLPNIAEAIDLGAERFNAGGRLIYIGAGTSGRLGALDAIELTPTYSVSPKRAFGILAGGKEAMYAAVEGAEDSVELAVKDLKDVRLTENDVVISIAASGRTPYSLSAIEYGNEINALTISVTCTADNPMSRAAQVAIAPIVGPEVITGSTRMKAGTAQKMVLNMLSTGIMIKTGKVYQNLMINVQPTNKKLIERSINILMQALSIERDEAAKLFESADNKVNVAIVMHENQLSAEQAVSFLAENDNRIFHKAYGK